MTNRIVTGLTLAALMLAVAFGLKAAQHAGWLEAETADRIVQVVIGLGLAAYGNLIPKQIGPAGRPVAVQARVQKALRVGGWSFALAGLIYAGLWAFAPLPFADEASVVPVAGAMAVTLGYIAWCFAAGRRAKAGGPGSASA